MHSEAREFDESLYPDAQSQPKNSSSKLLFCLPILLALTFGAGVCYGTIQRVDATVVEALMLQEEKFEAALIERDERISELVSRDLEISELIGDQWREFYETLEARQPLVRMKGGK
jgi:uncharacterized protein HemX